MNESTEDSKQSNSEKNAEITSELSDNEDILFELEECLQNKEATLQELKKQADDLEKDIQKYSTSYTSETGTLEEDITIFRSIASKYVKEELIEFYVDRMKKIASKKVSGDSSTISELCKMISSGQDA